MFLMQFFWLGVISCDGVVCKLAALPWSDADLKVLLGCTAVYFRKRNCG